jgi:tRNA threonylcarbamoyl adenosine modification protein YeaZ
LEKNSKISQKILAVETSGKTMSIALAECSKDFCTIRSEMYFDIGLRHSEILKESCAFLMEKSMWKKEDLTALAVCTGPGSFTGLRVGIAFTRAMAQVLQIPLIGITAFEVIAHSVALSVENPPRMRRASPSLLFSKERNTFLKKNKIIGVLIDSIGNEVFTGFFNSSNLNHPIEPYKVYRVPELCKELKRYSEVVLAGQGFLRHEKEFRSQLGMRITAVENNLQVPRAEVLVQIAAGKIKNSVFSKNIWKQVVPFYLRLPIAVERKAGYRAVKN